MNNKIYEYSGNIKRLLLLIAIVLIFTLLRYAQGVVNRLRKDSSELVQFYAEVYAKAATEYDEQDFSFIFDQIIKKMSIPMIISSEVDSGPTMWKNIGIETTDLTEENIEKVEETMREMDIANAPIPLMYEDHVLGYIHYGDNELIKQLQLLPYVQIAVVALFIFLGYMAFQMIRASEKRSIWAGMAKETAHQLGTPLSSLMGWMEMLKSKYGSDEIANEMSKDLGRLEKIAARFSKIGSKPSLEIKEVKPVIEEVMTYFERRLPQRGTKVQLVFESDIDAKALLNPDLFSWAIENLIKNALDSVPQNNGKVEIEIDTTKVRKIFKKSDFVVVDVIDNGKGILRKNRKNIFRPGYSSKERGWGLGLSLTKRIIEDYHHGKIFVQESKPNYKTVIRIMLKTSQ
jgi:signal transduction histidine kinase